MFARLAISALLISLTVVFAYHLVASSDREVLPNPGIDLRLARLEARLQRLEDSVENPASLRGREDVGHLLTQLERRLADLEALEGKTRTGSPGPAVPAAEVVARGPAVLEDARAKALAENLRRAKSHQRERIRRLDPNAAEADMDAAAELLAEYTLAARELHRRSSMAQPAEREAIEQRRADLRLELQVRLRSHLADDVVGQLTRETVQNR